MKNEIDLFRDSEKKYITSRRIAEEIGKMHKHVIRDIEALIEKRAIDSLSPNLGRVNDKEPYVIEDQYESARGMVKQYLLNTRAARILAASYDPVIVRKLMKLIDAMEEYARQLEEQLSDERIVQRALEVQNKKIKALEEDNEKLVVDRDQQKQRADLKEQEVVLANHTIRQQIPKVEYYNNVLQAEGLICATVIAKDLGMSAQCLNKILKKAGVQFKRGGVWVLYQKYAGLGYTKTRTFNYEDDDGVKKTHIQTYWTQRGREFAILTVRNYQQGKVS